MDKSPTSHSLHSVQLVDSQGPTLVAKCPEYGQLGITYNLFLSINQIGLFRLYLKLRKSE
jgi:hypothetical protein